MLLYRLLFSEYRVLDLVCFSGVLVFINKSDISSVPGKPPARTTLPVEVDRLLTTCWLPTGGGGGI